MNNIGAAASTRQLGKKDEDKKKKPAPTPPPPPEPVGGIKGGD